MRLTRTQIEEWYAAQKLPRQSGIVFRAFENEGRLILGAYRKRAREGIYILHPNGRHVIKRRENEWSTGGVWSLFGWCRWTGSGYRERNDAKSIRWADEESRAVSEAFMEQCVNHWSGDEYNIIRRLEHIEEAYGEFCRHRTAMNKERRIEALIQSMPPLPTDLYEWAHETAFAGAHYMFGKKDSDVYFCTACGKKHQKKHLRDRARLECVRTGKRVKVEKRTETVVREARVLVLQNMPDGQHAVARHVTVWVEWGPKGCTYGHGEQMVILLPKDGRSAAHKWYYHVRSGYTGRDFWDEKNLGKYRVMREYLYPHTVTEALRDTVYARLGLEVAAARGWEMQYNNLMMAWTCGQTEYLIKGGFRQLIRDIADTARPGFLGGICSVGQNVQEALMLDGQRVARLRAADGGIGYLRWLREEAETGERFSEDTLVWLGRHVPWVNDLDFIASHMTYTRIANYLRAQIKKSGLSLSNLLHKWRDYMGMAKRLNLNVNLEGIYRPRDLVAAHAELTEILNAKRDEMERERIEKDYPAVAPTCARIKPLYEWTNGTYVVRVPAGAADIMSEGRLQHHCVGTTDRYFDRIAEGESYILFLRKCKSPETPWYTMEVEPGGAVRQLRTLGDDEGKDRAEAKSALRAWRAEIIKRLRREKNGKAELEAAEVSREKRLQEFEELRRGGNVIRGGRLAGRLLVEVLEADFKEYNESDTACAV